MIKKNLPSTINAWAFYDWANSVFPLVITSTIFPVYYNSITSAGNSDIVEFFGRHYKNTSLYSYALSFAFLLICCIAPFLSGIADYTGRKKLFMQIFCYSGACACSALFFFTPLTVSLAIILFIIATIGYSGSLVFYNAFLPEIATNDRQDEVSARGFGMGYFGSSILLIFSLSFFTYPEFYGIRDSFLPARITFLLVGIWWICFSQVTFRALPTKDYEAADGKILFRGYLELKKVWLELNRSPVLKKYLFAFFLFNMGVQTVMYVAAIFGAKEIKMAGSELILIILIIQFVAIGGAYLFSFISRKKGNFPALGIALTIWIGVCAAAYFINSSLQFYILAVMVGTVMGGTQSLARSTYSKLLPETMDHASYFSFYDICEKLSVVIGLFAYGYIEEITGNMRYSVLAVMGFFIAGLTVLMFLIKQKMPSR